MKYADYFLLILILVFAILLFVYIYNHPTNCSSPRESFSDLNKNVLLPADKVINIQGLGIPDTSIDPPEMDTTDDSAQSVDGTPNGPKSLFMFAYNKCDVGCCDTSSYSCDGGCVCITPEQYDMVKKR